MRKGLLYRALDVIDKGDIIIEVLDARFPNETRNEWLEKRALRKGKKIIFVLNKADLISRKNAKKEKGELEKIAPTVFLSAKKRFGIARIRRLIGIQLHGREGKVGIIGYPNTGKSSLINALKGKRTVGVSIKAGFTRGLQNVRISRNVLLIDGPGIIPFEEGDEFKLVLLRAKAVENLKDPELVATKLIEHILEKNQKALEEKFGIDVKGKNPEKLLEEIALKRGRLKRGGIPDTETMAKQLILMWEKDLILV